MLKFKEFKTFLLKEADDSTVRSHNLDKRYFTKSGKEVKEIDDKVTKCIIELKKQKATAASKLIDQFSDLLKQKKEIDKQIEQTKEKSYRLFEYLFDARDAAYTRVVDTASLTLTMSKHTISTSEKFDVDKFFEEVEKIVTPNLFSVLIELKKKLTEVKEIEKKSTLTPALKESPLSDLFSKIKQFFKDSILKLKKVDNVLNKWKSELK